MRKASKQPKQETDEEWDAEFEQLFKEIEAADKIPLTPEDLAWFESLPEAPPLPTREGETFAIFLTRASGRLPAARRKKPGTGSKRAVPAGAGATRHRNGVRVVPGAWFGSKRPLDSLFYPTSMDSQRRPP
jgi:hypothetical protein